MNLFDIIAMYSSTKLLSQTIDREMPGWEQVQIQIATDFLNIHKVIGCHEKELKALKKKEFPTLGSVWDVVGLVGWSSSTLQAILP